MNKGTLINLKNTSIHGDSVQLKLKPNKLNMKMKITIA